MNQYEQAEFKRASRVFLETQERRNALEGKDKRLFEQIEAVDIGNYSPTTGEVICIAKVFDNNAINSCMHFFKLGFLKGQRAEKNRRKKVLKCQK